MIDNQDLAVKNKLADYVFVETHDTFHQQILLDEGYSRCHQPEYGPYRVYRKKPVNQKEADDDFWYTEEEDRGYVEDED